MAKAGKAMKYKAKSKGANLVDEKTLEAELEHKYKLERFYDLGDLFANFCLFFMGIRLFLFFFLPGARYAGAVGFVFYFNFFVVSKFIARYKGTKHEEYGWNLFRTVLKITGTIHEAIQVSNCSLASEEGRNAHAAMVILTNYLLSIMIIRIFLPRDYKGGALCILLPPIALKYPRFGIFAPRYEALAIFVATGLGLLIGTVIDEMRWRHYLLIHKKELEIKKTSKELSKESRKRAMAMEVLSSYNDSSSFFEIR